jgi:hypothetical protein
VAAGALSISPGAAAAEQLTAEDEDCDGLQAVIKVPLASVDPVVPDKFTIATDDQGRASLIVGASHCPRVRIAGVERETVFTTLRIELVDPDPDNPPDEPSGPTDATYLEAFHQYQLWIASDNRDLVRLFRDQGHVVDRQAVWVDDLDFELDPLTGAFRFEAPPPTPSPFTIEGPSTLGPDHAFLGPPVVGPLNLTGDFWAAVPKGTMKTPDKIDVFRMGPTSGRVVPAPGSEMETMFCGADGSFKGDPAGVLTGDPFDLSGTSLRSHFIHGAFRPHLSDSDSSDTGRPVCSP